MNNDNEAVYKNLESRKKAMDKYNKTANAKKVAKNWTLKTKYGLSLEDYNNLLKQQKHKCAICGIDEVDVKKGLCVDHCHDTDKVRELLCGNCNVGLGMFKDRPDLLSKAIKYLKKHK